jgi:hypothetical protein
VSEDEVFFNKMTCCQKFHSSFSQESFNNGIYLDQDVVRILFADVHFSVISNGIGIGVIFYTCLLIEDKKIVGEMS